MTEKDANTLLEQIRNIIWNRPADGKLEDKNQAEGNLSVSSPDRKFYMAEELKQLHASLKHIIGQIRQVINGDYSGQRELTGTFSEMFHEMIVQSELRENKLKEEVDKERRFNALLVSIMDSLKELVIVTQEETGEILYANELAKKRFHDPETGGIACGDDCPFMARLQSCQGQESEQRYEFQCFHDKIFQVKAYSLLWEDKKAVVHLITDITYQKENEAFLEVMAYKDELTGLNNRRNCLETIDSYIEKGVSFSICMIDLDDLKQINDQHGHLHGDEYIKLVSEEIKKSACEEDFTCRYGGDEFVVLFKGCDEQTAAHKLAVIDQNVAAGKKKYPMSISYGAVYVEVGTDVLSESVLKMADERMYRFKRERKQKKQNESSMI